MNATPSDQRTLLDLADLDRRILVAESNRKNPSQAARVAELTSLKQGQSQELAQRLGSLDDIKIELSRLQSDVSLAHGRRARDEKGLATASDPKQAVAYESEIVLLTKRLNDLEDAELDLMERIETAEAAVAEQKVIIDTTNEEGARLTAEARALIAQITIDLEELARDRAAVAGRLPEALLKQYDRVGASLITRNTCGSCNMVLNASDLQEIRSTRFEEVVFCPSCGAIMVRTEESGL